MDFSGCASDASIGPAVHGCRGGFDFTLRFEQVVFSIVPSTIFIALWLSRILVLVRRRRRVDGTWFQLSKSVGTFCVALLTEIDRRIT